MSPPTQGVECLITRKHVTLCAEEHIAALLRNAYRARHRPAYHRGDGLSTSRGAGAWAGLFEYMHQFLGSQCKDGSYMLGVVQFSTLSGAREVCRSPLQQPRKNACLMRFPKCNCTVVRVAARSRSGLTLVLRFPWHVPPWGCPDKCIPIYWCRCFR